MRREVVIVDGEPRIRTVLTPRAKQAQLARLESRVAELELLLEVDAEPAPDGAGGGDGDGPP